MMRKIFSVLLIALSLNACGTADRALGVLPDDNQPYQLDTGDKLRVTVFGHDNLTNSYTVDGSGRISMPLIGQIPAKDLTTASLGQSIEQRLKAGYIREPRVTVDVDTYRPFFILGEVTTAGQFQYVNGMTVQTAVAIAGGYSPRADQKRAIITRKLPGGEIITGAVDISAPVRPGDSVKIPERWF